MKKKNTFLKIYLISFIIDKNRGIALCYPPIFVFVG